MRRQTLLFSFAVLLCAAPPSFASTLTIGSKRFTESYLLAEIVRQRAESAGEAQVTHQQGLGNTAIVFGALTSGAIDVYPEYTGTIAREILKLDAVPPLAEINARLAPLGLAASTPLGFNNTYALAMPAALAQSLHIASISDLKSHPTLRLGLSQEFIGRADSWPGLQRAYALPWTSSLRGLDHGLAYEAVAAGQVDVIDIYSTDAKLGPYHLTVLEDDLHYFPRYDAVLLTRADLPARLPKTWAAIRTLEGRIDAGAMQRMNAAAEIEHKSFELVAREFLASAKRGTLATLPGNASEPNTLAAVAISDASDRPVGSESFWAKLFGADFGRLAGQHLALVFLSLAASVLIGIPLGMVAAKRPRLGAVILAATGVLQTIPSLALLAILIPLTGHIGLLPAFIALSLYALLPIVRNTHAGLTQVAPGMRQAALSLGMTAPLVLRYIELPLARATIMAGIKTSAVINVGTATIAAFIGAGGFGERIVTGLALNDNATLLAGAIPVAVLAVLIEGGFALLERASTPAALRR
ncbi:MAG: ABC transporter permease subunit [Betaproteobacteria bacterium]|nr:ABC transporter permease subunit [Betaproteobacteria bacterium]